MTPQVVSEVEAAIDEGQEGEENFIR